MKRKVIINTHIKTNFVALLINSSYKNKKLIERPFKGQCHEIFDPRLFFINQPTLGP
jgi:hypothetical protein